MKMKMKMKRLLSLLMLVCVPFVMCACPGGDPTPTPGGDGNKCPTCGNDPCTCPTGNVCPDCGNDPCVCVPEGITPHYVQTYPYTDEDGVVHIRYQDTYDFGRDIRDITDVVITSTVTGTTEKDSNLLVKQKDGKSVYADGCGSATVKFRGNQTVKIQVDPSPINMLFVTGQSNASGDIQSNLKEGYDAQYYNDYIRCPETMAYFTRTGQVVSIDVAADNALQDEVLNAGGSTLWGKSRVTFYDYHLSVPKTLDWETAANEKDVAPQQLSKPKGETTYHTCGWNAALAYEWIEQTGERVWIVNCSQGGMEIQQFQPSEDGSVINNEYYQAVAVFNLALETLYKEVDAGHFVLNHMVYYWYHGESNSNLNERTQGEYTGYANRLRASKGNRYLTAEEYVAYFTRMHEGFTRDVVYNHNGVEKKLEFCGLMTTRNTFNKNTYSELELLGPRAAQYYIGASNEGSLKNVFIVSSVNERWIGESFDASLDTNPEADAAVEAYMLEVYGSAKRFKEIFGYDMPTTVYEMHPGVHYLMHGHNEMGMDAARNSLRILNLLYPQNSYRLDNYAFDTAYALRIVGQDGMTEISDILTFDKSMLSAVASIRFEKNYHQTQGVRVEIVEGDFTYEAGEFVAASATESYLEFKVYVGGVLYDQYAYNVEYR